MRRRPSVFGRRKIAMSEYNPDWDYVDTGGETPADALGRYGGCDPSVDESTPRYHAADFEPARPNVGITPEMVVEHHTGAPPPARPSQADAIQDRLLDAEGRSTPSPLPNTTPITTRIRSR
jgi:hypothetical protein